MSITRLQLSILVALASEPLNGYGVEQQIREDTNSILIPSYQSVYQALASLEGSKYIETISTPQQVRYQLAPRGRRELKRIQSWLELTLRHLQNRS